MKETVLFHANILSKKDVPFINQMHTALNEININLIIVGWNKVLPNWSLLPKYYKLPSDIHCLTPQEKEGVIVHEFEEYNLSLDFLVDRFNWWFPKPQTLTERKQRIGLLHYHLHYYLKLIKQYNPILLVVWNGNDPRQYIFNSLGKYFNIKTTFMERGPLPSVVFFDEEGVLANSSVKNLKFTELNKSGNTREYDQYKKWYQNSTETLWEQPSLLKGKSPRKILNIPNNKKITLFIGQIDNDVQTKLFSPYFNTNLEAFQWFVDYGRREGYFVLGKHHPKSQVPLGAYQEIYKGVNDVLWTDKMPLEECLEMATNVVLVNSSVVFDALLHNKPVFSLGTTMLAGKDILYEYTPKQTESVLNNFYNAKALTEKLHTFNRLMEYLFNENIFFIKEEASADRLAKKINTLKKYNDINQDYKKEEEIVQSYEKELLLNIKGKNDKTIKRKNLMVKIRSKYKRLKYLLKSLNQMVKERDGEIKFKYGLKLHHTALIKADRKELISVGKKCYVGPYAVIFVQNFSPQFNNSFLEIGEHTTIGEFSNIRACGGKIKIGSKVQIAQHVNIIASNHLINLDTPIIDQPWDENKNFIEIGDDVWIGCGVTILPGSKIGRGAVIGANSLIRGIVPENVVVAGNPNKILKERE
tara:strand:- start:27758 stop:29683 length:1926 start_codon:yes stop_codon:yes gene_type:complete